VRSAALTDIALRNMLQ